MERLADRTIPIMAGRVFTRSDWFAGAQPSVLSYLAQMDPEALWP
jgi:hypothetical protein